MFDKIDDLFKRASGPGDLATILLAGTAGFVLDAGLNVVGFMSPGYVGITAASTALGIKKSIEASASSHQRANDRKRDRDEQIDRAKTLADEFRAEEPDIAEAADREHRLLKKKIADPDGSRLVLDSLVQRYREGPLLQEAAGARAAADAER